MTLFLGFILILTALALALMMVVQAWRGTADLLCVRNFVLLGFIFFQLFSGAVSLFTGEYSVLAVTDQPRVGVIFTVLCVLFAVCLLWFYSWGRTARAMAERFTSDVGSPGPVTMLGLATAFVALGILGRFVLVYVPFAGPALLAVGSGLLIVSGSMAAWAAAPRWYNPAISLPAGAIVLVAMVAVLAGEYGRRDLVGLVAAIAWGAYHGHWKHLGFRATAVRLGMLGVLGVFVFGAVTATRNPERLVSNPSEVVKQVTSRSPLEGMFDFATGQWAGANSMFLIQSRPREADYDVLHTARYFLAHPIPRYFWRDKPHALGHTLPDEARVRRVGENLNLGPGIIGHIWNDNPWLAFIPYTLVLAFVLRLFDELIRRRPYNPFVVLPMAVGLGEFVALARGEAGLFFVRALAYTAGAWIAMAVVARVFRLFGWTGAAAPVADDDSASVDWGEDHVRFDDESPWDGSSSDEAGAFDGEWSEPGAEPEPG